MTLRFRWILITLLPLFGFAQSSLPLQDYFKGNYNLAAPGLADEALSKNKESAYYLGKMYLEGLGVAKDKVKGYELMQESATLNYVPAQMVLGKHYLLDEGNFQEAWKWFQKAAEQGNSDAEMFCGMAYLNGIGVTKNIDRARSFIIKAAQNGDGAGQSELAKLFLNSKHQQDQKMGMIWLKKAVDKGDLNAEYMMGYQLLKGGNIEKDIPKAIELLVTAANNHITNARLLLGDYYLNTPNSPQNFKRALYWYLDDLLYLSAPIEYRNPESDVSWSDIFSPVNTDADSLQHLYQEGELTPSKQPIPLDWLTTLAKKGDTNAARELAMWYYAGNGVETNKALAKKWFHLAAQDNDMIAKFNLERMKSEWGNEHKFNEPIQIIPKLQSIQESELFNTKFTLENPEKISMQSIVKTIGQLSYNKGKRTITVPSCQLKVKGNINLQELIRIANLGDKQAQFQLGVMYAEGIGFPVNLGVAIEWYRHAAQQNYANADYCIGVLALEGKGNVKKSVKTAEEWLTRAALKGNINAQFVLGELYELGIGEKGNGEYIGQDFNAARAMYGLASVSGSGQARYNLARLYESGLLDNHATEGELRNHYKLAFKLYKQAAEANIEDANLALAFYSIDNTKDTKAQHSAFTIAKTFAEKNNPKAQLLLALLYDRGIGTEVDKSEAITLYQELIETDNPIAEYILGSYYGLGIGISKDEVKASELLNKASLAGLGYATYNLAILNYQQLNTSGFIASLNKAIEQNYREADLLLADYYLLHEKDPALLKQAVTLYHLLADTGNVDAALKLGFMYQQGIYFDKNYQDALSWYQKAAVANNSIAQFALGEMYQLGQGTDRDLKTAELWYEKAARVNFVPALVALGYINDVDKKNYPVALRWYELARKNNSAVATYNLGLMYDYGKGVPVEIDKAKRYYQQAINQGFSMAEIPLAGIKD